VARAEPVEPIAAEDCKSIEGLLAGCVVMWDPYENRVIENVVETSGVADIAVSTVDLLGTGVTTEGLGNCFTGNTFSSTAPTNLEQLAPCDGAPSGGDWSAEALDLVGLFGQPAAAPPADAYKTTPEPEAQPNMPDAATAPPRPAVDLPGAIDVDAIVVPERPDGA
jgi:hypothetical protein